MPLRLSRCSLPYLCLWLVWLMACTPLVEPPPTLAPTAAPPPTLTPIPPPSPTPLPSPLPPVATLPAAVRVGEANLAGISFFYDEDLIRGIRPRTEPARAGVHSLPDSPTTGYYYDVPDYLFVVLQRVEETSTHQPALLIVQPLRSAEGELFPNYPEPLQESWLAWEAYLAEGSEPLDEASQPLLHPRFLETGNGRGWRYVATAEGELTYIFRGVTADGRYALWWQYPLRHLSQQPVAESAAADFAPDVRQLDLMVQTLFVNAEASTTTSLPSPEPNCVPDARFVADVTIPDGTTIAPRTPFTKTWRIQNTGTCTWSAAYTVQPTTWPEGQTVVGELYRQTSLANWLPVTPPGGTAEVSLLIVAPAVPGYYRLNWQLVFPPLPPHQTDGFPAHTPFGASLYSEIRVDQFAQPRLPRGGWEVYAATSPTAEVIYPLQTTFVFDEAEIRVGEERCEDVHYSGRLFTGAERTPYLELLPPAQQDNLPPYFEVVETNCDLTGLAQFALLETPPILILTVADGLVYLRQ